jgi:group I intron endonuclease
MNVNKINTRIHYLYVITDNLHSKKYIGQTINLKQRWIAHKTVKPTILYIDRAIKKYGIQNFTYQIVAFCETQRDADCAEQFLINIHDSRNKSKGYNIKPGGKVATGWKHTSDTKRKISLSEQGKTISVDTKLKMSDSQIKRIRLKKEFKKMSETKRRKKIIFEETISPLVIEDYKIGSFIYLLAKKYKTRTSTISKILSKAGLL